MRVRYVEVHLEVHQIGINLAFFLCHVVFELNLLSTSFIVPYAHSLLCLFTFQGATTTAGIYSRPQQRECDVGFRNGR